MRVVKGLLQWPDDAAVAGCASATIELRDVSVQDAPSTVVASTRLHDLVLRPGGVVPFALDAPEVAAGRALSLRVQVDRTGPATTRGAGGYLTTVTVPVAAGGHVDVGAVPLTAM